MTVEDAVIERQERDGTATLPFEIVVGAALHCVFEISLLSNQSMYMG